MCFSTTGANAASDRTAGDPWTVNGGCVYAGGQIGIMTRGEPVIMQSWIMKSGASWGSPQINDALSGRGASQHVSAAEVHFSELHSLFSGT